MYKIIPENKKNQASYVQGVNTYTHNNFTFAFPEKYIILSNDPIFLHLINGNWKSCKLMAELPVRKFNDLLGRAIRETNIRGAYFKNQLFGYDPATNHNIKNTNMAIKKLQQLITEHPILATLFEDYTSISNCFQFKIGLTNKQIISVLNVVNIDITVKNKLLDLWQNELDKDTYIYMQKTISTRGRILHPLSSKKDMFIASHLTKGTKIVMLYSFHEQTLTFFENGNSQPLKTLMLVKKNNKPVFEIQPNPNHVSFKKIIEFYKTDNTNVSVRIHELNTGINLLPSETKTTFTERFISGTRLLLPEKWLKILKGIEAHCHPALLKMPTRTGFTVYKSLVFDFSYNNTYQRIIFMNNRGKKETVSNDLLLQFSVSLATINNNMLALPHLNCSILVDNSKAWHQLAITTNTQNSIVAIHKVYESKSAIPLELKKIILPNSNSNNNISTLFISDHLNFSERIQKKLNGILKMNLKMNEKEIAVEFGEAEILDQHPSHEKYRYSSFGNKMYNLICSGHVHKINQHIKSAREKIEPSANNLNFSNHYIEKLEKANVNIAELINWLKSKNYVSNFVNIDFSRLSKQTLTDLTKDITNYFQQPTHNASELANGLIKELQQLQANFSPHNLTCYALLDHGLPLAFIFTYKNQFFRPYEFVTIKSRNNQPVLTAKIIRNNYILTNPSLYKYELNKIVPIDKLLTTSYAGWHEKNRYTIEKQVLIHFVKGGELSQQKQAKALFSQILEAQD